MCNPERFWRKKYKHSQPPVDIFGAQHFAKKNFHFPPPPHQSLGFFARLRNIFLKKGDHLKEEDQIGLPALQRSKRDNSPGWRRSRLPLILLQHLQYWWHDARCTHINDMHIAVAGSCFLQFTCSISKASEEFSQPTPWKASAVGLNMKLVSLFCKK